MKATTLDREALTRPGITNRRLLRWALDASLTAARVLDGPIPPAIESAVETVVSVSLTLAETFALDAGLRLPPLPPRDPATFRRRHGVALDWAARIRTALGE